VQVGTVANDALLESMTRGVKSADEFLRVKQAAVVRRGEKNSWIEVVLDEGKNRQIRRILDGLGIDVVRLIRVAIGPLVLGDLAKGRARRLSLGEKAAIDRRLN
jgi:23S rRNA pseudouridine2605 synthase